MKAIVLKYLLRNMDAKHRRVLSFHLGGGGGGGRKTLLDILNITIIYEGNMLGCTYTWNLYTQTLLFPEITDRRWQFGATELITFHRFGRYFITTLRYKMSTPELGQLARVRVSSTHTIPPAAVPSVKSEITVVKPRYTNMKNQSGISWQFPAHPPPQRLRNCNEQAKRISFQITISRSGDAWSSYGRPSGSRVPFYVHRIIL